MNDIYEISNMQYDIDILRLETQCDHK